MDEYGDGCLRFGDFKKAMKECGITLPDRVSGLGMVHVRQERECLTPPAGLLI
jgi:hypothetical protein